MNKNTYNTDNKTIKIKYIFYFPNKSHPYKYPFFTDTIPRCLLVARQIGGK